MIHSQRSDRTVTIKQDRDDKDYQRSLLKSQSTFARDEIANRQSTVVTENIVNMDKGTTELHKYLMEAELDATAPKPLGGLLRPDDISRLGQTKYVIRGTIEPHSSASSRAENTSSDRFTDTALSSSTPPPESLSKESTPEPEYESEPESEPTPEVASSSTTPEPSFAESSTRSYSPTPPPPKRVRAVRPRRASILDARRAFIVERCSGCDCCVFLLALFFMLMILFIFSYLIFLLWTTCLGGLGGHACPAAGGFVGGAAARTTVVGGQAPCLTRAEMQTLLAENNRLLLRELKSAGPCVSNGVDCKLDKVVLSEIASLVRTENDAFTRRVQAVLDSLQESVARSDDAAAAQASRVESTLERIATSGAAGTAGAKGARGAQGEHVAGEVSLLLQEFYTKLSADIATKLQVVETLGGRDAGARTGTGTGTGGSAKLDPSVHSLLLDIIARLDSVSAGLTSTNATVVQTLTRTHEQLLAGITAQIKTTESKHDQEFARILRQLDSAISTTAAKTEGLERALVDAIGSSEARVKRDIEGAVHTEGQRVIDTASQTTSRTVLASIKDVLRTYTAGGSRASGDTGASGAGAEAAFNPRMHYIDFGKPIFGTRVVRKSPSPDKSVVSTFKHFFVDREDSVMRALSEDLRAGNCWPTLANGFIDFAFARPVVLRYIAVAHPVAVKLPNERMTAPQNILVTGKTAAGAEVSLGRFVYDKEGSEHQFFPVAEADAAAAAAGVVSVSVRFDNYGGRYTCLYNLGLLGEWAPEHAH